MEPEKLSLLEGLAARRSCRVFRADPIPAELLRAVFRAASAAPSAKNAQPWESYVVTGEALAGLRREIDGALSRGETASLHGRQEGENRRARARELGAAMMPLLMCQGWEDGSFIGRCLRFFDAPVAAVICADEPLRPFHDLDIGMYTQSLCLAATAYGLGSCILGYPLLAEPAIRRFLALPDERKILITAALGYPDESAPLAQFRSSRVPLKENVHFL